MGGEVWVDGTLDSEYFKVIFKVIKVKIVLLFSCQINI